jgi:glycosyltransferase involved in cell wall biosynthesis
VTKRFRIGVDARAFASPAGGVRRYVWEIYGALPLVAPDVDVIAIGASHGDALPKGVTGYPARPFPTNFGWMALSIPLAVRDARLDVFHAPAYTAPLWGVHPQAVTIHDVSYERKPEWNAYKNDRVRRFFYRRSALSADRIITDSEFSRREITAAYGIPAARIAVVPLAAADRFTPGAFDAATAPPGLKQPYALHVGDLHVRRNLSTALDAVLAIRGSGVGDRGSGIGDRGSGVGDRGSGVGDRGSGVGGRGSGIGGNSTNRLQLVLAGVDRGVGGDLRARAAAAGDSDALMVAGPVSEDVLVNLYRGASMLLYPSRYEGFGLPVLEAMRCGVPVIAADCASVPEIVAETGVLLDPLDVPAWREAIGRLLTDRAMAMRLRDAGLARAAGYSWARTAKDTIAVLRECAKHSRKAGR